MQETQVWSLGWEDPLQMGIATHPSILAWRIPWTEEPGQLQGTRSQRVRREWVTITHTSTHTMSEGQQVTWADSLSGHTRSGQWGEAVSSHFCVISSHQEQHLAKATARPPLRTPQGNWGSDSRFRLCSRALRPTHNSVSWWQLWNGSGDTLLNKATHSYSHAIEHSYMKIMCRLRQTHTTTR